jgi:hypothetical protein
LSELKVQKAMLQAQVEAMQLHVDQFPCTCHTPEQPLYPYARPPSYQPYAHTRSNLNQGRSMDYPPYYRKGGESPVSPSPESQASLPTHFLDYSRHANQQHREGDSVGYGYASKYYQQPYGVAHSKPNGFYYHPYSGK